MTVRPDESLMPAEFEVMRLMVHEKMSQAQVAAHRGTSKECVRALTTRVRRKIGADNTVQAALWFQRRFPDERALKRGRALAQRALKASRKHAAMLRSRSRRLHEF